MGVKRLWEALESSNLIEQFIGNNNADIPVLARSLDDGPVFAVDLSMWILQAGQQADLQQLFSQEEAAAKVAFERVRLHILQSFFLFTHRLFFFQFSICVCSTEYPPASFRSGSSLCPRRRCP